MVYPNFFKREKKPKELLKMFVKANISVGFLSLKNRNKCQRSITKEPKTKQNKQAKQKQKQKQTPFLPSSELTQNKRSVFKKIKQSHLRN